MEANTLTHSPRRKDLLAEHYEYGTRIAAIIMNAGRTSELQSTPTHGVLGSVTGGSGFRHVPFRLSLVYPHHPGDNTCCTKVLDGARGFKHKLPARLPYRIANVAVRLYPGEPVLHRHVHVQHPIVAQG